MKFKRFLCKVFGHKVTQTKLVIWQIKNNPVNVARYGYTKIICPRCKKSFSIEPDSKIRTQDETLHGKIS